MKVFDQHVFDVGPAWAKYATRNAWGDLSYWADKPTLSACGLYFEGAGLHQRGAIGFEQKNPRMIKRVSA